MAGMKNRSLKDHEYKALHNYFLENDQLRNMLMFSVQRWAGYRISEALSLKISDVFNPDRTVKEKIQVKKSNMKRKKVRPPIPVHNQLKDDLLLYKEFLIETGEYYEGRYLFQSRKGENRPITYVQATRIIKAAFEELEIYERVATHSNRKTFATKIYENTGNDIRATQVILGHSNIQTTINYLEVGDELIASAVLAQ